MNTSRPVAAIVTEYRRHSHADVIVGKVLEGYLYDGGARPDLRVLSMYVDQFPEGDMSRALAGRFGFRLCKSIDEALTLGGRRLAVDGVLCIGEHGRYRTNARGQILYPRRRFLDEVLATFDRTGRAVPVFNDKHLAQTWQDARWMVDSARARYVPLMAGSSVPVTWRRPDLTLPRHTEMTAAVAIGYGPFEGYGFHALEGLQCMVERRHGGECGVRSVQCVLGAKMWRAMDAGWFSRELLEAALARVPAHAQGDYRAPTERTADAGVFLIEYNDGFKAAVAMLNGYVHEGDGGAFTFACRVRGREQPLSTLFYLQQPDPFAHFSYQVQAIETLVHTGHAPYPVERTLLTTGILDAVMISRHEGNRKVATPYLDVRYQATDWPHATDPVPGAIRR
jgi:hypothetical protein